MSKRYIKYSAVILVFAIAATYNACMVDGGALDNKKNLSSSGDGIKEKSGVGGWSTYPGGTTVSNPGTEANAPTGTSTGGTTSGSTAGGTGSTTGTSGGASGGGNTGVTGGSGNCASGMQTSPASGTSTPITCEAIPEDWARLEQWVEDSQSAGIPYCGVFKSCKNCCGPDSRYDMFVGMCGCPTPMDVTTLGATSDSRCEDEGLNYLAGFMEAKRAANIPCTTVKDCMNCCGPSDNLDKFHVQCER